MNKMSKRTISLLLAAALIIAMLPMMAFAAEAPEAPEVQNPFAGKTVSILGDSISTFGGVSNNTLYNSTIGSNAVYYSAGTLGVYRADTWWQQTIDALDMELLVNNSWSGSCVLHTRAGTAGAYVDRCVQLHNNDGEEPDVIVVFMGTNDFSYYQSALGTADIDYEVLISDSGYESPATSCEAYAIMLDKMTKRYPDAEIYCMGMTARRSPDKEDSYADVGQPTAFNGALKEVIEHFGANYVDLENCGIDAAAEVFDSYMGDGRVHPNVPGMDKITETLISSMLGEKAKIFNITYDLTMVKSDNDACTALQGAGYETTLTADNDMTVTVTMGGEDVTESFYSGGRIAIDNVIGDIVITAAAEKTPASYRWELDENGLSSVGADENAASLRGGSVKDGVMSNAWFALEEQVVLCSERPWTVEFKVSGAWSGMILSAMSTASAAGNTYLFKTNGSNGFVGFGESTGSNYENYGIVLNEHGVNTAQEHVYRLENRPADDGTNMVYLLVDGSEIGAMDNFFIGGSGDQGKTVNWLSGRDLTFAYIGANGHAMNNCTLEYLRVVECGHSFANGVCTGCGELASDYFTGKKVSILSHSMSTYVGVSNDTNANSTIGNNDVYYTEGRLGVYRADTWWQQVIDALDMELLVNNSWSGSCIFMPRKGEASVGYGDRAVNLHNDHSGEEPDIIFVYLGCNDFAYYKDSFGKAADVDYSALIRADGDGTYTYAEPTTTCEAYAIMLHKVGNRYPGAEIYCMTSTARREVDYTGDSYPDAGQPTEYSAQLQKLAQYFGYPIIDLENAIPKDVEIFDLYIGDKRAHANALGMDQISNEVLSVMLGGESEIRHVTSENGAVAQQAVLLGGSYCTEVALPDGYSVVVTMDGKDISSEVCKDGKITVAEVSGDISVEIDRAPMDFRWEVVNNELISVGNRENPPEMLEGTITSGELNDCRYALTTPVVLKHGCPWSLEWKCAGDWRAAILSFGSATTAEGSVYLTRTKGGQLCLGTRAGTRYDNYGIDISYLDEQMHTFRLDNRIAPDGSNMVWLFVDGTEIGPMNNYYIGSSSQNVTSDWVSGKDFRFSYMGAAGNKFSNCQLEYLQVCECVHAYENGVCIGCGAEQPALAGKKLSVLGASISTYAGISNNAEYNSTIGNNAVYYTEGRYGVYADDTWWMQSANDLGMELLVNNSWSGSSLLYERSGTVGAYVDRCVQLHNNNGEEPDIIAIQMGTNDFQYYKDTLGTADIDYAALITDNGGGTYTYATPVTSLEAAAIVLHKISVRYPNAELYYLNISQRVDGTDELIRSFNAELKQVVEHFGAHIVDIYGSAITMAEFDTYIGDGRVHPNTMGMDAYTEAFKRTLVANTAYRTDTHTVCFELEEVSADYGDDKIVASGDAFTVGLTAADEMTVTVTMGGEDITNTAYTNGIVSIDAVTDDVVITATSVHIPRNYRWEFDGEELVCTEGNNALTKMSGTTTDGVFSETSYELERALVLKHDLPWVVEWKCEGTFQNSGSSSGARIFTSTDVNSEYNALYIFKSNKNGLIAMGEKTNTGSHNYGLALGDCGIDWTAEHSYRLVNRIAADGSNMVYLFVDGEEIGAMNHYFVGTADKNTTSDWLSGKDFVFPYMGTDTHGFTNASIEYISAAESHVHTYANGICTVCGGSVLDGGYTHAVPENQGMQNAIDRAYSLTDVEWTPVADVPGVQKIDVEYTVITFEAGKTYKGIPYSGVTANDCYVGLNVSLESYLTALENENSVLYTENLNSTNSKAASYYGTVCSKFVQYALDVPGSYNTNNIPNIPGMETIALPGEYTVDQIKPGDVIVNTATHTTICTDILYDADGNVAFVEISEAVSPLCRRLYWSVEEFYEHFADYRLCRYDYIDETPAIGETKLVDSYALMTQFGDKYNYKVSSTKGVVDVLESGYDKAVIIRDGVVIDDISLNGAASFTFDRSVPGNLEMYLEKADGTRSNSVYACVVKSSVSVEDASQFALGRLTVTIDGSCGTPLYVQVGSAHAIFCNVEGQDGTVEIEFPFSKVSNQQVRVAYQNEYGIYLSRWVSFTAEENPSSDPLLSQGKYWNGYNITPSSPTPVVQSNKVGYWSYTMVPVEENTTYYSVGATRLWYLDANGEAISTYNAYKDSDVPFQFTTPEGTAYVSIAYSPNLVEQGTETMSHVHTYANGICTVCGEDTVEAVVEGGKLTVSGELEPGTRIIVAAYKLGRLAQAKVVLWQGEYTADELPECDSIRLFFVDERGYLLRGCVEAQY